MIEEEVEVETTSCPDCHDEIAQTEADENSGYCETCREDYFSCEDCDEMIHTEEMTTVQVRARYRFGTMDRCICTDCRDENYSCCADCNNFFNTGDMSATQSGDLVCNSCRNDYYCCHSCDDLVHADYIRFNDADDEHYCPGCYEDAPNGDKSDRIEGYGYKPSPRFNVVKNQARSSHLEWYGIEVEVDSGVSLESDIIDPVWNILNKDGTEDNVYFKEDGSLDDNGFEMVSHPCSYEYHMTQIDYEKAFKHLVDNGFRSHQTDTCGLHIHISRTAFGEDENPQMYHISRFMYLIEKFYDQLFTISRRTQHSMDQWAQRYGLEPEEKPEDMYKKNNGSHHSKRYFVVNFKNYNTIEVRAFRGTLVANTLKATLQFVKSFKDIANSKRDLTKMTWDQYKKYVAGKKYLELNEYLKERGL